MKRILLFINKKNITTQREVSNIIDENITSKNSLYITNQFHNRFKRELSLKNIEFIEIANKNKKTLLFKTFSLDFDNKFYGIYIPLNKQNNTEKNFNTIKAVLDILNLYGFSAFDLNSFDVYPNSYDISKDIKKSIDNRYLNYIKYVFSNYGKVLILISFFVFIGIYSGRFEVLIPIFSIILLTYVVKDIIGEIVEPKKRYIWYGFLLILHVFTALVYLLIKYFKSKHFISIKEQIKLLKERKVVNNKRKKDIEISILTNIDKNSFWKIIEYSKELSPKNKELQIDILIDILKEIETEKLVIFRKIREYYYKKSYTSNLWAIAYMLNNGCSDDGFDYYINWLISEGKQKYYDLQENPEKIVEKYNSRDEINGYSEDFGLIETIAFEKKHSESIDYQFDFDNIYNKSQSDLNIFEFADIEFNWKDENDLKQSFPKFYSKFSTFD